MTAKLNLLSLLSSFRRFTRSNSVTTAVQADLDFHDNLENSLESIEDNLCPGPMARQFSRDASTSTVSIQGSGNHYHACAADDDFDADFDPSILPPPDPWIDSITEDPLEAVQRSVCHRDGHWFLKLLQAERDRMEGWCQQMEREERENSLPEDSKYPRRDSWVTWDGWSQALHADGPAIPALPKRKNPGRVAPRIV